MKKELHRLWILLIALTALFSFALPASAETGTGEIPLFFSGINDGAAVLGLNDAQYRDLSAKVLAAIRSEKDQLELTDFTFPESAVSTDGGRQFITAFTDIIESDPSLYYASLKDISCWKKNDRISATLIFGYMDTGKRAEIRAAADRILSGIAGSSLTGVEKALLVHDRLTVWCEYDYDSYLNGTIPEVSYTIYGALVNRICVCEGYTAAYNYLMYRLGIPTRSVSSVAAKHVWNIVTIGGKDYYVDITYDDPVEDVVGKVSHHYFMISTARLKQLEQGGSRGTATDYDTSPVSNLYDNALWDASDAAFTLLNGKLYFIDNREDNGDGSKGIYEWNGGNPRRILSFRDLPDGIWYTPEEGYLYRDSYARLSADGSYLYFNLAKNVYRLTPGGEPEVMWTPSETNRLGTNIIGFRAEDGWFTVRIGDSPNVPHNPPASTLLKYQYAGKNPLPTLKSVSVVSGPAKTEFSVGERPDFSGLVIRKTYSDGTTEDVTVGFTFSDVDTSSVGQKTVTVLCDGKQTSFTVSVRQSPAVLNAISIGSGPSKTEYYSGEAFDQSGMKLILTMSDGTKKEITSGFEVTGFSSGKVGKQTLTVQYGGKTASFTVTVKEKETGVETGPSVPETDPVAPETDPVAPETDPVVPETDPVVPETGDNAAEKEAQAFLELVDGMGTVTEDNYLEKTVYLNQILKANEKLSPAAKKLVPASVMERLRAAEEELQKIAEKISGSITDAPDTGASDTEIGTGVSDTDPVPTDPADNDSKTTDGETMPSAKEKSSVKTLLLIGAGILVLLLLVLLFGIPGTKKKRKTAPKK